jgi:hypothetical protein
MALHEGKIERLGHQILPLEKVTEDVFRHRDQFL